MSVSPANHPPLRILILDDEATIRTTLTLCLEATGHQVTSFGTGAQALEAAAAKVFDLLFLDLRLGIENGLDYIPQFLAQSPWMKIVVITAYASIDTAVEAMRRGATDYLPKPFTPEQVELLATKIAEVRSLETRVSELQDALDHAAPAATLASQNLAMQASLQLAQSFAPSNAAILIQGESGAGKRSLAHAIHNWSKRRLAPFMFCSSIGRAEQEITEELFGAADAAGSAVLSRIERCSGGTLYIDDLCALPHLLQTKLLQLLQSGTFERQGNYEQVPADVRVIAGASKSLAHAAESGVFRQDLYYALSAKLIELPPLRDRTEDFRQLADLYLTFYARQAGKIITSFTADAFEYLLTYPWPGNLRELRNVIERSVILARPPSIDIQDLPPNMLSKTSPAALGDLVSLDTIEELHIRGVLATTKSLESAAKILGIDYATLWRRRKKYGL